MKNDRQGQTKTSHISSARLELSEKNLSAKVLADQRNLVQTHKHSAAILVNQTTHIYNKAPSMKVSHAWGHHAWGHGTLAAYTHGDMVPPKVLCPGWLSMKNRNARLTGHRFPGICATATFPEADPRVDTHARHEQSDVHTGTRHPETGCYRVPISYVRVPISYPHLIFFYE